MSTGTTAPPDRDTPSERNSVLLLVIGGLVAISAVIAGLVIFSSGEAPAEKPEPEAAVRTGDESLVVGKDGATTKVVVYEDFASQESREFEIASRDFLRIEASRGRVQVEYRPFVDAPGAYSRAAMAAWVAVLTTGTPHQALTFHDVLFDHQPEPGSPAEHDFLAWAREKGIDNAKVLDAMRAPDQDGVAKANQAATTAGVSRTPTVVVDGDVFTGGSPTQLADKLQRLLLETK
jgi:protein-disulfide isomerase